MHNKASGAPHDRVDPKTRLSTRKALLYAGLIVASYVGIFLVGVQYGSVVREARMLAPHQNGLPIGERKNGSGLKVSAIGRDAGGGDKPEGAVAPDASLELRETS